MRPWVWKRQWSAVTSEKPISSGGRPGGSESMGSSRMAP